MTICFAFLCENGRSLIMASDKEAVHDDAIKHLVPSKIIRPPFGNMLISCCGDEGAVHLVLEAFSNYNFLFPNESFEDNPYVHISSKTDPPDIQLWTSYYRFLRYMEKWNAGFHREFKTSEFQLGFIIAYEENEKMQLSYITEGFGLERERCEPYAVIGIYTSFTTIMKKDPWHISRSKEEAVKKANEVLDFYYENISGISKERTIEVLVHKDINDD